MKDYLVRSIGEKENLIGLACVTTDLVEEAARLHGTSPTATAAMGRALTGALLFGALLKQDQRVGLKFEGNGPLKKIIAEADNHGTVRGLVGVPGADLPARNGKFDVSGLLGKEGTLTVVKDVGLKEPYTGVVNFLSGEIAEDLAYYFAASEQVPSAVGLGVFIESDGRVSAAGGFLVQTLPSVEETMVDRLLANIQAMPFVTELLRQGKRPEEMFDRIFSAVPYKVLGKQGLAYHCTCSRSRIEKVLVALGHEELRKLIAEQE
jgi:molecular chaperone Hsp33